jgi:hypothetical protein
MILMLPAQETSALFFSGLIGFYNIASLITPSVRFRRR